jgi:ATP-dependent protease ClpP protease subunit
MVRADVIVTQNGRRYEGDLVGENATSVTLRVEVPGSSLSFTQQIAKSHIKSWDRPNHVGVPYVRIPIVGEIGTAVTGESVRKGLAEAQQFRPAYLVFVIDSNGGRVDATFEICDLIQEAARKYRVVACVKKAYSGGAMIAMACPEIFMVPGSEMGAAVPMQITRVGVRDIEAKFASAIEGKERTYVTTAGHNDLIMRGMMEMNLPIYLNQKDGKAVLDTSGPGMLLKPRGQILTLTPEDAQKCGVARIAGDLADVGKQVTGGAWYEASHEPWDVASHVASSQQQIAPQTLRMQGGSPNAGSSDTRSQAIAIREQIFQLQAKANSDTAAINDLTAKCNKDCDDANTNYHNTAAAAANDRNGAYEIAIAKETLRKRLMDLQNERDAAVAPLQADADTTMAEINKLRQEEATEVAGTPRQ